ncbi:hypothetical protein IJF93_02445 [Candidatus Saccharibacteria bacterium]|nr:hypothetical protein [Candidatus Saccharibacteria bacterium]
MRYYYKQSLLDMLSGNWWPLVAIALLALTVIIARNQFKIKTSPKGEKRVAEGYGDEPYLAIGFCGGILLAVMLFVESYAGIIQLLDNLMRAGDEPVVSVVFATFVALLLGVAYGTMLTVVGVAVSAHQRDKLNRQLAREAEAKKKRQQKQPRFKPYSAYAARRRPRRQLPKGEPRVPKSRVSAEKGMHRR